MTRGEEKGTYGSSTTLEHGHPLSGRVELVGGDDCLEDVGGDIPQLVVLSAEEDDGAVALGVERAGDVLDGLLDDLLDAVLGHGAKVLAEGVEGAAVLDEVEDRFGVDGGFGGHFVLCGWGCRERSFVLIDGETEWCRRNSSGRQTGGDYSSGRLCKYSLHKFGIDDQVR